MRGLVDWFLLLFLLRWLIFERLYLRFRDSQLWLPIHSLGSSLDRLEPSCGEGGWGQEERKRTTEFEKNNTTWDHKMHKQFSLRFENKTNKEIRKSTSSQTTGWCSIDCLFPPLLPTSIFSVCSSSSPTLMALFIDVQSLMKIVDSTGSSLTDSILSEGNDSIASLSTSSEVLLLEIAWSFVETVSVKQLIIWGYQLNERKRAIKGSKVFESMIPTKRHHLPRFTSSSDIVNLMRIEWEWNLLIWTIENGCLYGFQRTE